MSIDESIGECEAAQEGEETEIIDSQKPIDLNTSTTANESFPNPSKK